VEPSKKQKLWSRLRVVLVGAVAAVVVMQTMRTTSVPRRWDEGALVVFEDALLPAILAAALALALLRYGEKIRPRLEKVPRLVVDLLLLCISWWVTARMTFGAFGGWPQIQDEISYDLIARRIANGTPVPSSHPMPEFFRMRFLVDDGRNYPLFQPGWPLLLAFFHKIKNPALGPSFAVAMLTVGTSRLAERLYGRMTSLLAGALVLSSGFINVVGCAYFAHAWAAALLVLGLERVVAALTEEDPLVARRAAIAGGLWGAWLVVTRLPTALSFVAAALVAIVGLGFEGFRPRPRLLARAKEPILALTLAFAVGPLAQAGWNFATTRNPLELPQDKYFMQTESVPHCHRLGFGEGVGCPREHPLDTQPGGYTVERAMVVSAMRYSVFRADAWGTAWPLALGWLFLLRKQRARDAVTLTATFAPIAIYFGFYYHAIQHGARLWADLMGPLSVMIAAGAVAVFEKAPSTEDEPDTISRWLSACGVALLVLVIHDEHTRDLPERVHNLSRVRQAERVRNNLDAAKVEDAVVYIANCIEPDRGDVVYGWASVLNSTPPEKGRRYLVRDFGLEHDRQLATLLPNRKHIRADCNGKPMGGDSPTPSPDYIVTEMEAKFPPDDRAGCYASIRGVDAASNRTVLDIRATSPAAWARFRQHVFEAGSYELRTIFLRRPDGGRFAVVIDGQQLDAPLDTRGDKGPMMTAQKPINLTAGIHTVEFRSLEGPGSFVLTLDRIELRKL